MKKFLLFLLITVLVALASLYRSDIPASEIERRYADSASRFIDLMGMRVHYKDQGDSKDTLPLVLLHGTSSSLHTWDSIVQRLGPGKRIIRMDLPAFGLTGASPERAYSTGFYVRFVDSLLQRLDVRRCILGGNSLGGGIAWNTALADTSRIRALVLLDASGYPKKDEKGNLGFKLAAMPGVASLLSSFTPRALIRKSLEDSYSDPARVNEALVDRYFELLLREGNRQATVDLFQSRRQPQPERIRAIRVPTLIIWGQDDRLIDVENAGHFARDIPGSVAVVIPRSGHVPMEETPDAVAEAILRFLERLHGMVEHIDPTP
jgi:pimeloyl-ACP methyl ester carboxylesterase